MYMWMFGSDGLIQGYLSRFKVAVAIYSLEMFKLGLQLLLMILLCINHFI